MENHGAPAESPEAFLHIERWKGNVEVVATVIRHQ